MPRNKKPYTSSKTKSKSKEKSNFGNSFARAIGLDRIFSNDILNFFAGLLLLVAAILAIISFFSYFNTGAADQSLVLDLREGEWQNASREFKNTIGSFGALASHYLIKCCFGLASFFIPVMMGLLGLRMMKVYNINVLKIFLSLAILMIWGSVFFSTCFSSFWGGVFPDAPFSPGGDHGDFIRQTLENIIGFPGLVCLLIIVALAYLTYLSSETIHYVRKALNPSTYKTAKVGFTIQIGKHHKENNSTVLEDPTVFDDPQAETVNFGANPSNEPAAAETSTEIGFTVNNGEDGQETNAEFASSEPAVSINAADDEEKASGKIVADANALNTPINHKEPFLNYKYPLLDLLKTYEEDGKPFINMEEQTANKNKIIEVLDSFGIQISTIIATVGPTITLYEITPAPGVRISKIRGLSDDLAMSLRADGVRIIAPMPGKGTIGIEVPNKKKQIVSMESILNSRKFQETKMELPLALGKTITNEVFMVDLAKIPHLLVAGATGQGKSVGLNAIITSLLYKKHPNELKFVLIDPKKVEFSVYQQIQNHFMAKLFEEEEAIITDVRKVVKTLNSLCALMDHRYDLLKQAGARNIKEYNEKYLNHRLRLTDGHDYMPYIVVIIDEFGDLIMTAGKEVELPIARIAQLARAVGIHMVIATQRPTTTIITGNIKANFPGRMAFRTSQGNDSKIILDRPGANQLIGKGDMLILANQPEAVRVQCAFVDSPEIENITEFIQSQPGPVEPFELPEPPEDSEGADGGPVDLNNLDPLFEQAAQTIVSTQQGSTSMIQRQYSIGYNRAGRLMDQLEKCGIVGPAKGSKPRDVLIQDIQQLDFFLSNLKNNR